MNEGLSKPFTFLTFCSAGWLVIFPEPYALSLATNMLLPFLAFGLCWRYSKYFSLSFSGKHTKDGDLTILFMVPPLALAMRALIDVNLLIPSYLFVPVLVAGICFLVLAGLIASDLRKSVGNIVATTLFIVIYFSGAIPLLNILLDKSSPQHFHLTIADKRHSTGKVWSSHFTLKPSEALLDDPEVRVSYQLYRQQPIESKVCLHIHSGAFLLKWYTVDDQSPCV
jgi:uncharacterized membrane protein